MPRRSRPARPGSGRSEPTSQSAPQRGSRSRPERAERARQILASARAVFSEKGYERASMAEIARRVGVVEGALYKHFASKRELLFAVIREMYEGLIGQLREGLGGIEGARNRLRFAIWSQLRAFTEEAGLCRVVISEIRPLDDYGQSLVRALNRELTGHAMRVLEQGIASGEFRADLPPQLVRDVIFGGIEHLAWTAVIGHRRLDVERSADALTEVVLRGIGAAEADAPDAAARLAAQVDRLESMLERAEA